MKKGTEGRREGGVKKRFRGKGGQEEGRKRTEGRMEGGVKKKKKEWKNEEWSNGGVVEKANDGN